MNRLIMDDLPTAWSPRNTILYFSSGGIVPLVRLRLLVLVVIFKISNFNPDYINCLTLLSFLSTIDIFRRKARGKPELII